MVKHQPDQSRWKARKPTQISQERKGSARKRVRALERLLKRDLPDEVRRTKEAELASLTVDVAKAKRVQRERAFSKKYHKIKFFERQKLERRIIQLKRRVESTADESGRVELERQLLATEHDLLYVRHFPRHKKYLSLFPCTPDQEGGFVQKQIVRIRTRIVQRAAAGLLGYDAGSASEDDGDAHGMAPLEADEFFATDAEEREAEEEEKPEEEQAVNLSASVDMAVADKWNNGEVKQSKVDKNDRPRKRQKNA
mmetsp:Transcript_12914/g.29460  ORF Transcript_12914/g.29460 Transcript_12914/m.29460 type:complete len:254 (-) Transcript_12914:197-958(-)